MRILTPIFLLIALPLLHRGAPCNLKYLSFTETTIDNSVAWSLNLWGISSSRMPVRETSTTTPEKNPIPSDTSATALATSTLWYCLLFISPHFSPGKPIRSLFIRDTLRKHSHFMMQTAHQIGLGRQKDFSNTLMADISVRHRCLYLLLFQHNRSKCIFLLSEMPGQEERFPGVFRRRLKPEPVERFFRKTGGAKDSFRDCKLESSQVGPCSENRSGRNHFLPASI